MATVIELFKIIESGNSLEDQWLRFRLSLPWTRVLSLVGELRSHKPCSSIRKQTNKTKQNLTQEFELASLLTQSFCLMEERAEVSLGSD